MVFTCLSLTLRARLDGNLRIAGTKNQQNPPEITQFFEVEELSYPNNPCMVYLPIHVP